MCVKYLRKLGMLDNVIKQYNLTNCLNVSNITEVINLTAGEGLETVNVNLWDSIHKKYKDGSIGERPSWRWKFSDTKPPCGMYVSYMYIIS